MSELSLFGANPFAPEVARGYDAFSQMRVRTKISEGDLARRRGRVLSPRPGDDYDWLMVGPTELYLPDGRLLAKYLPGALLGFRDQSIATLRHMGRQTTDNRGLASGYDRLLKKVEGTRTRTPQVNSMIAGYVDPGGAYRFCRLTAYTADEWDRWSGLHPLFRGIDASFKAYVPDRYAVQQEFVNRTHKEWVVGDTVFTTITVNKSYPTGVHTDAGDLDGGFSNLAVYRTGEYAGGTFIFPEYRVGVDMQDGDLLLMDAHQWHGNAAMTCKVCGDGMGSREFFPSHDKCGSERVSVVCYYRTKMAECGTREEEYARAVADGERRIEAHMGEADVYRQQMLAEMAAESGVSEV